MSIEVLRTNALHPKNQNLVAIQGCMFKLTRKCRNYYRWKCCRNECDGFIITTKNFSNIKLIKAGSHIHSDDDTDKINNLRTMITNHCQMNMDTNEQVTEIISSSEYNGIENICDDVWLSIFKYLKINDIVNMMIALPNFERLTQYTLFSTEINFKKFQRCLEEKYLMLLKESTQCLTIKGYRKLLYTTSISFKFLKELKIRCPNLTYLAFRFQIFENERLSDLFNFNKLKYLIIEISSFAPYVKTKSKDFKLSNLQCLEIELIKITCNDWFVAKHFKSFFILKNLRSLTFHDCINLVNSDCLNYMNLGKTFENLQALDLRNTIMDDFALRYIFSIKSLKYLLLHKCLSGEDQDNITDSGLSFLVTDYTIINHTQKYTYRVNDDNRCKLLVLFVSFYPLITDHFLNTTAVLYPSLEYLNIIGTSCTQSGIELFKILRPEVNLIYE